MRKTLAILTIVLAGLVMGCPRSPDPGKFTYTSADLQGGWRGLDQFLSEGTPTDGAGGGEVVDREVTEPDVIRQSGDTLYVLNQYRGLTLVDLDTQAVIDQVATLGYPRDLYVAGNRAYVLVAYAANFNKNGDTVSYDIASRLYVVDISTPADSKIVSSFDLDGDLTDSRLVGDVLYAVTAEYDWGWYGAALKKSKTSASHIVSVNIANENNIFKADQVSTDNIGDVVYATSSAIFVAGWDWENDDSTITYIDISDPAGAMQVGDAVVVNGYVYDKFKLDVYNDVLRVISSGWQNGRKTYVTTIDITDPNNLVELAHMNFDRADGDSLFATRFDGSRAYVVTFFQVDPLFVLDLSDPANPVVAGELEVPGYSTHIEPRGDRLIALGVDNTNGWQVSLSLFNVSDPANPTLEDRVSFGQNWSWSSAFSDVKALTVLDDTIIVPFSGWEEVGGGYDRLQFVSWTPDDLTKRGTVDLHGSILRSFEYNGSFYGVTSEQLSQIDGSDLDNPTVTNTVVLAENVADFVELSSQVGVEIVTQYDTGKTTARAVALPLKKSLGEATVNVGSLISAKKYGDKVVLVGTSWSDTAGYKIATVDFSDTSAPEASDVTTVDVWPYYGYWWMLPMYDGAPGGGVAMKPAKPDDKAAGIAVGDLIYPWFPSYRQDNVMVVGDTLVLRCTSDSFDTTIGDGAAYEGIALVDLQTLELKKTVGFGFDAVSAVMAAGDKLYISSKTYVDQQSFFPWLSGSLCAYFMTQFDPETIEAGPTVNVPGTLVQYDPQNYLLTLRDDQWSQNYDYSSTLRTLSWNGGLFLNEADNEQLPNGASVVLGRQGKVYVESYDNGVKLDTYKILPAGSITAHDSVLVTESWGSLIDANATSAYFGVGGGAIARYDCTNDPDLKELVEVMGTPDHIVFGENGAYAPLGYFGIVELPL